MFRIINLFIKHKKSSIIYDVDFIDTDVIQSESNVEKPFTTVFIGTNGVGKSYLLSIIADLFRRIDILIQGKSKKIVLRYSYYDLKYTMDGIFYNIIIENNKL